MSASEDRAKRFELAKATHAEAINEARRLKEKGLSVSAIAQEMGVSENYVRNLTFPYPVRPRMTIEGPYSFRGLDGHKTPAFIFELGGNMVEVGEVTIRMEQGPEHWGLKFEVELKPEYKDIKNASFEIPMRYAIMQNIPEPEVSE